MSAQLQETTQSAAAPVCIALEKINDQAVGGKAQGLQQLLKMGLPIPATFVVVGATPQDLPEELEAHYHAIGGGKVAVRSSAIGEDSADASFAGQYETILDVEGIEALKAALNQCLASVSSERARAYQDAQQQATDVAMTVVVQGMVDARAAGVLFAADPVSGRRNCVVLDAVAGLGEALVSGEVTPDHYRVSPQGDVLHAELVGDTAILSSDEIRQLIQQAKQAESKAAQLLDLEWAIDQDGTLYWLQARPITVLPRDPNELDCVAGEHDDLYTRYNVGEVMPGATTPLSYSTTGRGLDTGIQGLHVRLGIQPRIEASNRFFSLFYGRIFLNLSGLAKTADYVAGSKAQDVAMAVCGRPVEELRTAGPIGRLARLRNSLRYFHLAVFRRGHEMSAMRERVAALHVPLADSSRQQFQLIQQHLPQLDLTHQHHIAISTGAGMLEPILLQILQRQEAGLGEEQLHARMAALLAAASHNDVESADIADGIQRIIQALQQHPLAKQAFGEASAQQALDWINSAEAAQVGAEYGEYMRLHGHRAFQEFEMRQTEWQSDPIPLIASIQAAFRVQGVASSRPHDGEDKHAQMAALKPVLRWLIGKTQNAVQQREASKSLLIRATTQFKRAYRHLADLLVADGALSEPDDIFFLTHEEIGQLIDAQLPAAIAVAQQRREAFNYHQTLEFEDIFRGMPEPLDPQRSRDFSSGELHGKPVSRGQVQGIARVVHSLEDAAQLQAGEILVTPATDIGWTPYFGVIAGLVTDIGSSVSHGAVIAREYGLPAVVNTRDGSRLLSTGDEILLDGDSGCIRLIKSAAELR